ncbi:hypothetical protein ABBQ38_007894 [Trebouxia sp. C0009 RCD-2024]
MPPAAASRVTRMRNDAQGIIVDTEALEENTRLHLSGNGAQVALPELPYTMEQLQQMQAAATAITAGKEGIRQCSVILHEFPMAKYTQYIELRGHPPELLKSSS